MQIPHLTDPTERTVIILVHGTFARGAQWMQPFSPLRRSLASAVKGDVCFKTFEWSGQNSHRARLDAGAELKWFIATSVAADINAPHYVICHSHGGMVALYALRGKLKERIRGVVCMGTPFINCHERSDFLLFGQHPVRFLVVAMLLLAVLPLYLTYEALIPGSSERIGAAALFADVFYFAAVVPLFCVLWTSNLSLAQRIVAELWRPKFEMLKLLVITVTGDEALWWLQRLVRWSELPIFLWSVARRLFVLALLGGPVFALVTAFKTSTLPNVFLNLIGWYFVVALFSPVMLLFALLLVLPRALRGHRFGFGESLSYPILTKITVSRLPDEERMHGMAWFAAQLDRLRYLFAPKPVRRAEQIWHRREESKRNRFEIRMGLLKLLRHCRVYESNLALQLIAQWINLRNRSDPDSYSKTLSDVPALQTDVILDERHLRHDGGREHPKVAIRLNNLARLYQAANRLVKAESLMGRALKIDGTSFGREHPEVATDLNNLAQSYLDTNRLVEAEPLMERALKITETSFGPDHPKVAIRLNNLAKLYQTTNRLVEAEPLMKRALKIDETSFGPDHPKVAADLNSLAGLYLDTNRLAKAEPLMCRCLIIIFECSRSIFHPLPDLKAELRNYTILLGKEPCPKAEVSQRLAEAGREAGYTVEELISLFEQLSE